MGYMQYWSPHPESQGQPKVLSDHERRWSTSKVANRVTYGRAVVAEFFLGTGSLRRTPDAAWGVGVWGPGGVRMILPGTSGCGAGAERDWRRLCVGLSSVGSCY